MNELPMLIPLSEWGYAQRQTVFDALYDAGWTVVAYPSLLSNGDGILLGAHETGLQECFPLTWLTFLAHFASPGAIAHVVRTVGPRALDALCRLHGEAELAGGSFALLELLPCPCLVCCPLGRAYHVPHDRGMAGLQEGLPLCQDPLCRRPGPHCPREYGCRWSAVHVDGKTCENPLPRPPKASEHPTGRMVVKA